MQAMENKTTGFTSTLNYVKFFTFTGLIFLVWAICFGKMIAGGTEKEMAFIYLGMGICPLLLVGLLFLVRRYELNGEEFIILNYWKKPTGNFKWTDFSSFNVLGGDGTQRFFQGIVLNRKDGTKITIYPTWVGNLAEMAEFISGKLPQA